MFRIGDFSRLSYVSIKALRYYDELGLLKPERVDSSTGYRYYTAGQLPLLNRIVALKDLGFTLDQIKLLLSGKISAEQIKSILNAKRSEIERQITMEQEKLLRVEARLKLIEGEMSFFSDIDVVVKRIEAQKVIGIREKVNECYAPADFMPEIYGQNLIEREILDRYPGVVMIFEKLCRIILAKGGKLIPPATITYYDTEYKETDIDMEASIPVSGFDYDEDKIKTYILPAVKQAACLIHHGTYDTLIKSYDILMKWIEQNEYQIVGPVRESYIQLVGFGASTEKDCITEIQFPVEKKGDLGAMPMN
ncbi:MAG: MerR family transcriptional regulator [Firmicutes bacterium]|nr:MerR family transcriptional regulator [Bacillota bacterium]